MMNTLDYHNENSLRSYPIKDGLTRTSQDGLFTLPNDLLVDMTLSVGGEVTATFNISRIVNTGDAVLISVADNHGVVVGAFNARLSQHTTGKDYELAATSDYSGAVGRCTIWELTGINAAPLGVFTFLPGATELCMRVSIPSLQGIPRISFADQAGVTQTLTGNITLVAESNLRFRYEAGQLFLDAGEGLGLNKLCAQPQPSIRTINGVGANPNGDFVVIPADCAALEPIDGGLMLRDTCSKPCMGCSELSELTNRAVAVESDLLAIRGFVRDIESKVQQLATLAGYTYDCQDCN